MSNTNLTSYNFHDSNIRVEQNNKGEVLFCLADVCKSLNLQNPTHAVDQIKKEFELPTLNVASFDTGYGVKEFTMITEPQLYFVMMRSNSKIAREFRQWICNEVLPSIRAQGAYVAKSETKSPATKKWYVEQLTALFESYGVNREVLARALDITSRALSKVTLLVSTRLKKIMLEMILKCCCLMMKLRQLIMWFTITSYSDLIS